MKKCNTQAASGSRFWPCSERLVNALLASVSTYFTSDEVPNGVRQSNIVFFGFDLALAFASEDIAKGDDHRSRWYRGVRLYCNRNVAAY